MIRFSDIYTQVIYDYLTKHDDSLILYKDIMDKYRMSYPTIRKRIKWLIDAGYIKKNKRHIEIIPQFQ